ncbi:MAG: hypothetical protein AB1374_09005 [Bacillota bacterium]
MTSETCRPAQDVLNEPSSSNVIKELVSSSTLEAKKLMAQAKEAARVQKVWESLSAYVDRGWPLHIISLLDKEEALISKLRAENHSAISTLEEVYRAAKQQAEALMRRHFPAYLEQACNVAGLPLDLDSRHPRYYFEKHFLELFVDERKGFARLSDYEGRLDEFPADIGAIVEAVKREHKRLFKRPFDGKKFLKKLRQQYLAIAKKENIPDGSSIPIRHITRRLSKNQRGFRTDEFLIDLSKLIEQGPTEIEGFRLDLQHTKDTGEGMLLYGPAGRGYIGFVTFRRVGNG